MVKRRQCGQQGAAVGTRGRALMAILLPGQALALALALAGGTALAAPPAPLVIPGAQPTTTQAVATETPAAQASGSAAGATQAVQPAFPQPGRVSDVLIFVHRQRLQAAWAAAHQPTQSATATPSVTATPTIVPATPVSTIAISSAPPHRNTTTQAVNAVPVASSKRTTPVPDSSATPSAPRAKGTAPVAHRAATITRTHGATDQGSAPLPLPTYALPTATAAPSLDTGTLLMLTGKFAVVLVLLLVCLRVLKAVMPGGRGPGLGRSANMVFYSEAVGDKQRICLLDLQTSIVVVGVSPSGLTPLSTITGAEEMEQLRKRYAAQAGTGERALWQWKGRRIKESVLAATESFGDPMLADALDAVRSLRQKITRL